MSIPTAADLYAAAQAEIQARQPTLTDFYAGSALDALVGAMVIEADQSTRIAVAGLEARMVATATGSDLDAAVTDRYPSLTRRPASASVGTLRFTRGASTGNLTIPAGTQATCTVSGRTVTFSTSATVIMAAAATTADSVASCTETGSIGNVAAGVVTVLPAALSGDATATVANPDRFVGGADAESDDAYRARAQAYPLTLVRATVSALEEGALTVPGVAYATVDESTLDTDNTVHVYVGDADGRGNAAMAASVTTALESWRAAGVHVVVAAATREEVTVTVAVYITAGSASDTLRASCIAAIEAYGNSLGPGQRMYLSGLEAAAMGVSDAVRGAQASSASTVIGGHYIAPSASQNSLRVTDATLTVTLTETTA